MIFDLDGECFTCEDYGIRILNDNDQCKKCVDSNLSWCEICENVNNTNDMTLNFNEEWNCDDCFEPTCRNCDEHTEEDGQLCSKWCNDEWHQ